jgi:hypothetical protein
MRDIFKEMVTKYSGNVNNVDEDDSVRYVYSPDIGLEDKDVQDPYMDKLNIKKVPYIGVNTKTLYLSKIGDWNNVKVAPNARIKELIIETTDVPVNLSEVRLDLDWVKFKYISIKSLTNFKNLKTDSIAFDKCKFDESILKEVKEINPSTKKLQIVACDVKNMDLNLFESLEELQLLYTLEPGELVKTIGGLKINKLVISGDMSSTKEDKDFINSLKKSGVKVEVKGPDI